MSKRDYYEVLGLRRESAGDEIKRAYRKAAMKYHPDRNPDDPDAEEKFKEASEAYEVLSNQEKRQVYDRFGHSGLSGQGFHGFSDVNDIFSSFGSIFEDFFGFAGGDGRARRPRRGADLRYDLQIEFEEAVFGASKDVVYEREAACKRCDGNRCEPGSQPKICATCNGMGQVRRTQGFFSVATSCPTCRGQGQQVDKPCRECRATGTTVEKKTVQVKIPSGVDDGIQLRVNGEGEAGALGGGYGDLYVVLHVKPSERFERHGNDLVLRQQVGIVQASLGCKLEVKTLEDVHTLEIPAGTQYGDRFTIPGAGVPSLRGIGRGDIYVQIEVVIPRKLNREQKEALSKFGELYGEQGSDTGSGGFFSRLF